MEKNNKPIRHAVRTYIIKENKVVAIKYFENTKKDNAGYYDIPGGKIEDGEMPEETAVRETKEEAGITINKNLLLKRGKLEVEYPERIFDFTIFLIHEYEDDIKTTDENDTYLIDIDEIITKNKIFPAVRLLNKEYRNLILNEKSDTFNMTMTLSDDNEVTNIKLIK